MPTRFRPSEIPVVSMPTTSANRRNSNHHPATDLGRCTPFQLMNNAGISYNGSVCVIGASSRSIGFAKAMIRRSRKPFVFLGTSSDRDMIAAFAPEWILDSVQQDIPSGDGAILLQNPYSSYYELCGYMGSWFDHFLIIHLGHGLQIGHEILNLLNATDQCLVICDSIPQSIRNNNESRITPGEFMRQFSSLLVFNSGSASKDLIELLPTYQYEKVSNSMNYNTFKGRSFFHPFRGHRGRGISVGQSRTLEYQKHCFEMDELHALFAEGISLVYNAITNEVFLADLV